MDRMNQAFEKVKMLVGMEVEDDEEQEAADNNSSFMDEFNRECTLTTKQVMDIFLSVMTLLRRLFDASNSNGT
ncbi:hypothetical protein HS088_TW07G00650 [Tripterygium wilfordii]|uniref:Uncharacterized protein n=1 Tax=Tripterygium wilfordii TaxID=458696 RepID=A0A7J7DFL1_TRIWF|nr:hypothetical protein HS088_TW07G00650 [Tripterygium wilfordii]